LIPRRSGEELYFDSGRHVIHAGIYPKREAT
jgi:hypothetical protein